MLRQCLLTAVAFITASVDIACNGDQKDESKPHPDASTAVPTKQQVSLEPPDLMTSVRGSPIRALVGLTSLSVSHTDFSQLLSGHLSIVDDQGAVVSLEVKADPSADTTGIRYIDLQPSQELKSAWHRVIVDLRGTEFEPHPSLVPTEGGKFMTRFHPDSMPVVRDVSYCAPVRDQPAVIVLEFSEPVDFVPNRKSLSGQQPIVIRLDSLTCTMLETVVYVSAEEEAGASGFNSHFEFSCSGAADDASEIEITLLRELKATSGLIAAFPTSDAPNTITLPFANAYKRSGGSCVGWHML